MGLVQVEMDRFLYTEIMNYKACILSDFIIFTI